MAERNMKPTYCWGRQYPAQVKTVNGRGIFEISTGFLTCGHQNPPSISRTDSSCRLASYDATWSHASFWCRTQSLLAASCLFHDLSPRWICCHHNMSPWLDDIMITYDNLCLHSFSKISSHVKTQSHSARSCTESGGESFGLPQGEVFFCGKVLR